MPYAQKISNIYKSNSQREIQPVRRLDKYDSISYNNKEQKNGDNFKEILKKELRKSSKN